MIHTLVAVVPPENPIVAFCSCGGSFPALGVIQDALPMEDLLTRVLADIAGQRDMFPGLVAHIENENLGDLELV